MNRADRVSEHHEGLQVEENHPVSDLRELDQVGQTTFIELRKQALPQQALLYIAGIESGIQRATFQIFEKGRQSAASAVTSGSIPARAPTDFASGTDSQMGHGKEHIAVYAVEDRSMIARSRESGAAGPQHAAQATEIECISPLLTDHGSEGLANLVSTEADTAERIALGEATMLAEHMHDLLGEGSLGDGLRKIKPLSQWAQWANAADSGRSGLGAGTA